MQEGYSICFNEWALDKEIKNELRLLLIISSLCAEKGYCYASNKYFADLFDETERSISKKIKLLETKKYINIEYERNGTIVTNRFIYIERLKKISMDHRKNFLSTVEKNFEYNNIRLNNIKEYSFNKLKEHKKAFQKPTIKEIEDYCKERNNKVSAEAFYDFYESKNWFIGKNKMKDWKACVRTWERRSNSNNKQYKIESIEERNKRLGLE